MEPILYITLLYASVILFNIVAAFYLWRGSRSSLHESLLKMWIFGLLLIFAGALTSEQNALIITLAFCFAYPYEWYLSRFVREVTDSDFNSNFFKKLMLVAIPTSVTMYYTTNYDEFVILPICLTCALFPLSTAFLLVDKKWKELTVNQKGLTVLLILDGVQTALYGVLFSRQDLALLLLTFGFSLGVGIAMFAPAAIIEKTIADKTRLETKLKIESQLSHSKRLTALGEMASGVAHEVNNPLAIVKIVFTVLEKKIKSGVYNEVEVQELFDTVSKNINRISKIISGLVTFSRDGSNDPRQIEKIGDIIDAALDLTRFQCEDLGIVLDVSFDSNLKLNCRKTEIIQAIVNIISNARDSVLHSTKKWIKIWTKEVGGFVEIHIENSGPIIEEDIREKIFQPFFTTKEIGKGTGLGLSMSRGIVASHLGNIELNNSGLYTEFIVKLPVA